ncbi:hypothetical protein [Chitinophaga barathri]|uniref:T9SS C-terminal target domain-containing protein n=1 Tax=Chitinophaga barathri TaxID=1647451 RepID=A0A3N4MDU5_9BACT|nr:hypothetical protein [Chitinophaga barathri]RPD38280.1 hypothetical protein EG028_25650 [Chitinophaga barathri]
MKNILFSILLCAAFSAQGQSPYTLTLKQYENQPAPALQSFCIATGNGLWLLVGGRTNGFHGTADSSSTFPTAFDNQTLYVIDPVNNKSWTAPIPQQFLYQLRSTNMAYCQDGNTLYCIGGYGNGCDGDNPGCYQTFPNLTAINVPGIISAIQSGGNVAANISTLSDPRMAVTGGYLTKNAGVFYLVFGQNYNGKYQGGVTGKYTQQIARFLVTNNGGQLSISNYQTFTTKQTYLGLSQFHRRDFVASTYINPMNRSVGMGVFGGVFNSQGGPFRNPIYIQNYGHTTTTTIDTAYSQMYCMYDCAVVPLYNTSGQQMYVSMIGGITDYYFNKNGDPVPSNASNFMPWFNYVSTLVKTTKSTVEYPQKGNPLPGYIGANAAFIPAPGIAMYGGTADVIDFAKLPSGQTMIGWMYGGIVATAEQSNGFNPTSSSNVIYAVYLTKN